MNLRSISSSLFQLLVLVLAIPLVDWRARAATTTFFNLSQTTNWVASGSTSDTLQTEGYQFVLSRDKLFTGGIGLPDPIGRKVRIHWPDGLEAQAITAGPNPGGAKISVARVDGQPFAITSFSFRLLGNTGGAGASLEVMPKLHGEDAMPDPLAFDATGNYGSQFHYDNPSLSGFDSYILSLYVDFALMELTVVDATPDAPELKVTSLGTGWIQISWPASAEGYVLQSTDLIDSGHWLPVNPGPALSDGRYLVDLATGDIRQWYRLKN